MNILFYTNYSPYGTDSVGGAETSLRLISEKFANNGNNAYFITKNRKKRRIFIQKKVCNGVKVYTLYNVLFPEFLIRIFRLNDFYISEKIHNLFTVLFIKYKKISFVHTYYELDTCLYFLKIQKSKLLKFHFVLRMAGMLWYENVMKDPSLLIQYKKIFENVDSINFISKGLYNMYLDNVKKLGENIKLKHYFIQDIGVDLKSLSQYSIKTKESDKFELVMATRFSDYQKRQDILVQAINIIKKDIPIKLTLIGDGTNRTFIQERIISLGLESSILIIPYMDQNMLWDYLKNSNLLCHACDYEGLSKIIIESMSLGLPVLVSNVTPLNDYIVDGENGYLAYNSSEEWAQKIKYIYENREQLIEISKNAKLFTNNVYNADKNILKYIEQFESLVK